MLTMPIRGAIERFHQGNVDFSVVLMITLDEQPAKLEDTAVDGQRIEYWYPTANDRYLVRHSILMGWTPGVRSDMPLDDPRQHGNK